MPHHIASAKSISDPRQHVDREILGRPIDPHPRETMIQPSGLLMGQRSNVDSGRMGETYLKIFVLLDSVAIFHRSTVIGIAAQLGIKIF